MLYFIVGIIVGQVCTWLYYEFKYAPVYEEEENADV